MYVGEHVEEEAKDLCEWLTKCLKDKMPPSQFSQIWNRFLEDGESEDLPEDIDTLDFTEAELDEIYGQAVQAGADRFLIFYNNAYVDIVALRGHPTGREVALQVLKEEENVDPLTDEDTREALGKEYLNNTGP